LIGAAEVDNVDIGEDIGADLEVLLPVFLVLLAVVAILFFVLNEIKKKEKGRIPPPQYKLDYAFLIKM
jgi:hypothetical protein|tara:strand:- start:2550 stop:2753 length:204 start_codon:yes stop_codon:yes gene_type:complete